jgi:hypothetical protein
VLIARRYAGRFFPPRAGALSVNCVTTDDCVRQKSGWLQTVGRKVTQCLTFRYGPGLCRRELAVPALAQSWFSSWSVGLVCLLRTAQRLLAMTGGLAEWHTWSVASASVSHAPRSMLGKRIQLFCDETVADGVFGFLTRAVVGGNHCLLQAVHFFIPLLKHDQLEG